MKKRVVLSFVLVMTSVMNTAFAQDSALTKMTLQQRLERLERMLSSEVLMEQVMNMEALREEITVLREQLELQEYELDNIKQRQRSLYLDMDRRINNVETGSLSTRSTVPVPPPTGVTRRPPVSVPVTAGGHDKDGKETYSRAFGLLKDGRYQPSIKSFEAFLKEHPNSKYADNAQYWLGEANYVSRDYKKALDEFQRLIAQYPDSTKIQGARLKIGYVYYELKNWSASREALQQVVKSYPDTTVARKADERLERIRREGH